MRKILIRHVGNMGDMIFLIPPVLETLKRRFPKSHITFVTAWGFKEYKWNLWPRPQKKPFWGNRNQSGFCIALMMHNPHIDQLVHWHDTKTALDGSICIEEGRHIPTWSAPYYLAQKKSGAYDAVFELDFGLGWEDNPITRLYQAISLPEETYAYYKIYLSDQDKKIAERITRHWPRPRIMLLEGLDGTTTRGWDPGKIPQLTTAITATYGTPPRWFGGKHIPYYQGRPLTLRENIALLAYCDVGIGVLSGPLHFAAAMRLPTLTLYADQVMHRAAPAYFLNKYITNAAKMHRTLLGPSGPRLTFLKSNHPYASLTPAEKAAQHVRTWQQPGKQSTKSPLAAITAAEVMTVLKDMIAA